MTHRLTQKQEDFCRLYFEMGNGTEAALAAGYSPKTAKVIASENLSKPYLMEIIEALRQKAVDTSIMNYQERQQTLTAIARQPAFPKVQRNVITSIDTLNKMDKIYSEGTTVNVDNRKVEITVVSKEAQRLLEEVVEGSGTEKEKECLSEERSTQHG